MTDYDWKTVETSFEKHPKLELKNVGDKAKVKFKNNGKFVSKEVLQTALKKSGKKGFARNSIVFTVETKDGMREFWLAEDAHSVKRELKSLMTNDSIEGKDVLIERIAVSQDETNYRLTKA